MFWAIPGINLLNQEYLKISSSDVFNRVAFSFIASTYSLHGKLGTGEASCQASLVQFKTITCALIFFLFHQYLYRRIQQDKEIFPLSKTTNSCSSSGFQNVLDTGTFNMHSCCLQDRREFCHALSCWSVMALSVRFAVHSLYIYI